MMALMGLIEHPGIVTADELTFDGKNMLKLEQPPASADHRQRHGDGVPGPDDRAQPELHRRLPDQGSADAAPEDLAASKRANARIELLEQVDIPGAASRMDAFPHQLSGGMSQRVMIAMAIAGEPKLLIADEPTTALDVTIQAQIMDLLLALQKEQAWRLVLITHDLAVVAETAQRVCVMYAGQVVEIGQVPTIFDDPGTSVQEALLAGDSRAQPAAPSACDAAGHGARTLRPAAGLPAAPRCTYVRDAAATQRPAPSTRRSPTALARCFYPLNQEVA